MSEQKNNPWARHFDAVGDELMRLAVACGVQLRDPGVVDRILQNDETVCGKRNPIGFRKLRDLVKATLDSISKASDRIGPKETKQLIDAITERLDRRRELGGTGGAKRPALRPTSQNNEDPRLAVRVPEGLAAAGHPRGSHHGSGGHPESDGLRHGGGPSGPGRTLYGVRADGDLRGARQLARAEHDHHDDDRDPHGGEPRSGSPRRRSGGVADRRSHAGLMVGALLVLAAVLRVGFLASFISEPVLSGFKAGIGVVIVLDQVPKLLGVHFPKGSFLRESPRAVPEPARNVRRTLAVGVATIALLLGLKRFVPQVPAPLVTVAAGIAAMALLGLAAYGVETVGEIPRGLPGLTLPDFSLAAQLWPGAMGIALMSFTETVAAARAFARTDEPALRPNQELIATGIATVGGAVLGGMAAGGGTSQTAVNRMAGARSQLAGLVTGGATLLTLLFLAPLISLMPQATLAAVVIVYSVGLIQAARVPRDLGGAAHGVHLGGRCIRRRHAARHSQRHTRRDHHFPRVAGAAGRRPAGVSARPQAGYERVPPALRGESGRRELRRPPDAAPRGPAVLLSTASGWRRRSGC